MVDQNKGNTVYGKHDEFFRRIYSFEEFATDLIKIGLSGGNPRAYRSRPESESNKKDLGVRQ